MVQNIVHVNVIGVTFIELIILGEDLPGLWKGSGPLAIGLDLELKVV